MMTSPLLLEHDDSGVARLTLNRPDLHNAFDDKLIAELIHTLSDLEADPNLRVLILTGAGKSFSAGADLQWMRRMADYSTAENLEDAAMLAEVMRRLDSFPRPVVGLINGPAYGGGVGLAACCDIVVASELASFCLSEVKLGLIPAVISPYVVAAIGARQARRYFMTAETIPATEALRIGLVHRVVAPHALEKAGDHFTAMLLKNGPEALREAKDLVFAVDRPITDDVIGGTGRRIAERRASAEGREGIQAFLDKRQPAWQACVKGKSV